MGVRIRPGVPGLQWHFPELNGGEERGINDAGIESFHGSDRLARETCQNILDAHDPTQGPCATAQFETIELPADQLPGRDDLIRAYSAAARYCLGDARGDPSAERAQGKEIFQRALDLLASSSIPVLRIGDYTTTGLTGSDSEKASPWYRLVRSQGRPKSEAGKGGTFGIGQRAPFAFSGLRTVLYSTRLANGACRFMGKSIICSHPDAEGVMRQNVGFFGSRDSSQIESLSDEAQIPASFLRARSSPGTDIYVLGFNADDWKELVIRSLLVNFFASIAARRLEVFVLDHSGEDETVSYDTLPRLFASHKSLGTKSEQNAISVAEHYYKGLLDPLNGGPFTRDIPGLGEVKFFVRMDPLGPQRVAFMRRPRILVYERGNNVLSGYAGILIAEDRPGNEVLASLENPEHDEWAVDNASRLSRAERGDARRALGELRDFVRTTLEGLATSAGADEEDLPGLPDYLVIDDADDLEGAGAGVGNDEDGDDIITEARPGEIAVRSPPNTESSPIRGQGVGGSSEGEGDSGGGGSNEGSDGLRPGAGDDAGIADGRHGGEDPIEHQLGEREARFRSWLASPGDPSTYVVIVRFLRDCTGWLGLAAAGEDGSYGVELLAATDMDTGAPALLRNGGIAFTRMNRGSVSRITVKLETSIPLCLRIA